MQNIKTIAGTFTIGTYEIPKQYVCAKTPTITQKNDICEIVTYDQQITVNGHNYAPVLHQKLYAAGADYIISTCNPAGTRDTDRVRPLSYRTLEIRG